MKKKELSSDGTYPSIRIFKNPLLERCTHVHPITPFILWAPVVVFWTYQSFAQVGLGFGTFIFWGALGLILWTLTEYVLHRYLFHYPAKSKAGKYFVFLFHGLHHDDPNDPTRLVFPPVPAIAIVSLLYLLFSLFIPTEGIYPFMAFFIIGYLCYDYIHYATHHFKMTSKVGRYLKKYHLRHHFAHEDSKYGVSSPLWDYIFQTVSGPKLSKANEKQL